MMKNNHKYRKYLKLAVKHGLAETVYIKTNYTPIIGANIRKDVKYERILETLQHIILYGILRDVDNSGLAPKVTITSVNIEIHKDIFNNNKVEQYYAYLKLKKIWIYLTN